MFSLHDEPRAPVSPVTYLEWVAFGGLLFIIAGLWYFIQFGMPGMQEQKPASIVPADVRRNLEAGDSHIEPLPPEVAEILRDTDGGGPTSVTSDIYNILSSPN